MRFLVTGASGHVGSHLTRRLVEHGEEVAVLARRGSDLWRLADMLDRVRVVQASLEETEEARAGIAAFRPEVVCHLAWGGVTGEQREHPSQLTSNVAGSLKLFELARDNGCRCWVGLGSQAEYGSHDVPLSEDLPAKPQTAYGIAKLCVSMLTEKLCWLAGMRFVWLRLLASYGPQDDQRHLIPFVIGSLLRGERPALTAGEQRWDYLYVDDAVEAIHLAAVSPGVSGIYNLASGEAQSVRSIAEKIRDIIDPSLPLGIGEVADPPTRPTHLEADVTRLRTATGWRPRTSLDEGLRRTVAWYRTRAGTT